MILSGNGAKGVNLFTSLGTPSFCFVRPQQPANSTQGTEKAKAVGEEYTAGGLKKGGTVPGVLRRMLSCHPYLLSLLSCHPSSLTTFQSALTVSGPQELMMLISPPHPPVFPSPTQSPA